MPSVLLSNKSGGENILSGMLLWSGKPGPIGGVQLRADRMNSGNIYVGYSGGLTVQSGGFFTSGTSGLLDGMQLGPGDAYFAAKYLLAGSPSGSPQLFFACDAVASGFARVFYEPV